ncbi:MAG: hypothetical protein LBU67_06150 [Oscillospiraceae bacterium]|nr:hypothetical protein [Oscillospiraceae bacterium]
MDRACGALLTLCLWASPCLAAPAATLPPGLPATAAAPQAALHARLYTPDEATLSLRQVTAWEDVAVVSGRRRLPDGDAADALWAFDLARDTVTLLYEARRGVEIHTPVYCAGQLYWAERYPDQPVGWRIRTWRAQTRRAELVRSDPYARSTVAPSLTTDGTQVYWYESDSEQTRAADGACREVTLMTLSPGEKPRALARRAVPVDWLGPQVSAGVWTVGAWSVQSGWQLCLLDVRTGENLAAWAISAMPADARSGGGRVLWRQGAPALAPVGGDAQGDQATAEEEPPDPGAVPGLWGELMLLKDGVPRAIDAGIEALLLRPEGVYACHENGDLCCYTFDLGRTLRLTPHGDYLPTLWAQDGRLLTLRAIDDGQRLLYRLCAVDTQALQAGGWPPLR